MDDLNLVPDPDGSLRKKFAAALLRFDNDAYRAAYTIVGPTNFPYASWMVNNWLSDGIVNTELIALRDKADPMSFLPTKAEAAKELYKRIEACQDPKDYNALMRTYLELMGHISAKGAVTTNVTTNVPQPRVMLVTSHGTDQEWKDKVAEQQRRLTDENAIRH